MTTETQPETQPTIHPFDLATLPNDVAISVALQALAHYKEHWRDNPAFAKGQTLLGQARSVTLNGLTRRFSFSKRLPVAGARTPDGRRIKIEAFTALDVSDAGQQHLHLVLTPLYRARPKASKRPSRPRTVTITAALPPFVCKEGYRVSIVGSLAESQSQAALPQTAVPQGTTEPSNTQLQAASAVTPGSTLKSEASLPAWNPNQIRDALYETLD